MASKDKSQNDIQSLSEDWMYDERNGLPYSGLSVQNFIKRQLAEAKTAADGKIGSVEYTGDRIFFRSEEGGQIISVISLSGSVYSINIECDQPNSFYVLSSDENKTIEFTASTLSGSIGQEMSDFPEDYQYVISVDNGSGVFVEKTSGSFQDNDSVKVGIRSWLTPGQNRIRIIVQGVLSAQSKSMMLNANLTALSFSCSFSWFRPWLQSNEFILDGIRFSGNLQKTLYICIDDDLENVLSRTFSSGTNYSSTSFSFELTNYYPGSTGIHTIELWMEGGGVRTDSFRYNVMCVNSADLNNVSLVVLNNIRPKVSNYISEPVLFEYATYNATSVTFESSVEDGERITDLGEKTIAVQTQTKNIYPMLLEYDSQSRDGINLTIAISAGSFEDELVLPVDNSTAFLPTDGAVFYMNSAQRSNGSNDREEIINLASAGAVASYEAEWEGFSFENDGWYIDNANQRALVLTAGCHITVPELQPLALADTGSVSFEIKMKVDCIADFDTPVFSIMDTSTYGPNTNGIIIHPNKLTVLTTGNRNTILQSIGLEENEIAHIVIVIQREYGGSNQNLCSVYINGNRSVHFSFTGNARFGNGYVVMGQDATDTYIYMMRSYNKALESGDVLANFINTITDGSEYTRVGVRDDNAIFLGEKVSYELVKQCGFNTMVVETDDNLPSIEDSGSGKKCTLHLEYANNPEWNVAISNMSLGGQGTTSMKYYRWNLRMKGADDSVWKYANGLEETGKSGYIDGRNTHPAVSDIVAKKNYASSMQGHKMGACAMYDELYGQCGLKSGLPSENLRVAIYQYPFMGFQKFSDGTYEYIGLYTTGPHKGDKGTFGYDGSRFPSLLSLEGPNHDPLGTRFLHPWKNVDYDVDEETMTMGGIEAWDVNFAGAYKTDKQEHKANIMNLLENEWKPAYEIVFFCSQYLKSFEEVGYTLTQINSNVDTFRDGSTNGMRNNLLQLYAVTNSGYDLYAFNYYSHQYELLDHDMLDYLSDYLTTSSPNTSQLLKARKDKFYAEAENYWAIDSVLFMYCYCVLIGATDNFAKNSYPFKFKPLSEGGRWCYRNDDLDSILDTDNNGQQTKSYSILPGDLTGDGVQIFQGGDSALVYLFQTAFETEIRSMMLRIVNGLQAIAGNLNISGRTVHETVFNMFSYYFWDHSSKYFPQQAYAKDTEWSYITPWFINEGQSYNGVYPLTQARGSSLMSEREWSKKRIAFVFSAYRIGGFTGSSGEYGSLEFTPARAFTFNVVPAIDMYPSLNVGGGEDRQGSKTLAGNTCSLIASSSGQTTLYLKGTDWLSYMGDMSALKLTSRGGNTDAGAAMSFSGKRLKKIKVGDEVAANVDFNAYRITIGNCPSLEEFDARNTVNTSEEVNLSSCKRLRKALLEGSSASGLVLPIGAKLDLVSFPDNIETLFLHSLPGLTIQKVIMTTSALESISGVYVRNCKDLDMIGLLKDIWSAYEGQTRPEGKVGLKYINISWSGEIDGDASYFSMLKAIAKGKDCNGDDFDYGYVDYDNGNLRNVDGNPVIEGIINVDDYIMASEWEAVHEKWPNLTINCLGRIIDFEDQAVKTICVNNWGGATGAGGVVGVEGEITMEQAAKVSSIGTQFSTADITTPVLDLAWLFPNLTMTSANFAFQKTTNVQRIIFPPSLVRLYESQFPNNRNLTVIIGDPINGSRFNQCGWNSISNYPTVVLYAMTPPTIGGAYFAGAKCYVPDSAVETYKTAFPSIATKFYPISEWAG